MPCYTPPPTYEEEQSIWERRLRHSSPTAEAFCEVCRALEGAGMKLPPKAAAWWEEHKSRDAAVNG